MHNTAEGLSLRHSEGRLVAEVLCKAQALEIPYKLHACSSMPEHDA